MVLRIGSAILGLLISFTMMFPADSPSVPKRLNASIGGFMGGSYRVELGDDGAITYTTFDGGYSNPKRVSLHPTPAQWREFRQTLDELKIWLWRKEYPSNGTLDGTQWSIDIAFADREIKTHGDNSYPDETGRANGLPDLTKAFNRYLAAVKRLIGGKTFK